MSAGKLFIRRSFAFLIDWNLVLGTPMLLFFVGGSESYFVQPSIYMVKYVWVLPVMGVLLIVFPLLHNLVFRNASIGKRIFGLRIVEKNTYAKPSVKKVILRSLFFYIPQIDLIVYLVTKNTIGGIISDTVVVHQNDIP